MALGYAGIGNVLERRTTTSAGDPDFNRDYTLDRLSHACKYAAMTLKQRNMQANEYFKLMAVECLADLKRDKRTRELRELLDSEEERAS
jgi:hypothetical protein